MATSVNPVICTGWLGPAVVTLLPAASLSARIFPYTFPTTTLSPTLSVPFWTRTVATGPLPRSSSKSMTVPTARRLGLARGWTSTSLTTRMVSRRSSMPSPVSALVRTVGTVPP